MSGAPARRQHHTRTRAYPLDLSGAQVGGDLQTQLMFQVVLVVLVEAKSVVRALEKDKEYFNPALHPWTTTHWKDDFSLATKEELAAELAWCQDFFKSRYEKLGKWDRKVKDASDAADKGEDYVDGETLDTKKWRKLLDDEVIPGIVKIQEEINEGFKGNRLRPYRRELSNLQEIANCVAYRVTRTSRSIYKSFDLTPVAADTKPEKLVTKTRQRPPIRGKYLGKLIKQINTQLGIGTPKPKAEEKPKQP